MPMLPASFLVFCVYSSHRINCIGLLLIVPACELIVMVLVGMGRVFIYLLIIKMGLSVFLSIVFSRFFGG
jgi:hypothetical protein